MSQLHEFDPDAVDCILFLTPVGGFGENDAIDFDPGEEGFTAIRGVDGDVTRTKIVGKMGELSVTLMQTSKANDVLSAIHNADLLANGGAGVGAIMIKDRNGTSLLTCDTAWIKAFPKLKHGKAPSENVWIIQCVDYTLHVGGT